METPIINLYRLFRSLHDNSTRSTRFDLTVPALFAAPPLLLLRCLPSIPRIPRLSLSSSASYSLLLHLTHESLSWSAALFVVTFIPLTFRSLHHPRYRITPLFPTPPFLVLLYVCIRLSSSTRHTPTPLLAPPFYPLRRQQWIKLCWLIHSHRGYRFLLPRLLLSCVYALTRDSRIIRSFWSFILISSFLLFYYFNKKKIYW